MTILEEIASLAKQVDDAHNAETNAAMAVIAETEKALQAANVRISVSVKTATGTANYARVGRTNRIGVGNGSDGILPWQECNRETKHAIDRKSVV